MYQVFYIAASSFKLRTGNVKSFGKGAPERLQRFFCSNCGTRTHNVLTLPDSIRVGAFPTLFDDSAAIAETFPPFFHGHADEAVIDLSQIKDGLPRITSFDPLLVEALRIAKFDADFNVELKTDAELRQHFGL